jgi:hypothetical protein
MARGDRGEMATGKSNYIALLVVVGLVRRAPATGLTYCTDGIQTVDLSHAYSIWTDLCAEALKLYRAQRHVCNESEP